MKFSSYTFSIAPDPRGSHPYARDRLPVLLLAFFFFFVSLREYRFPPHLHFIFLLFSRRSQVEEVDRYAARSIIYGTKRVNSRMDQSARRVASFHSFLRIVFAFVTRETKSFVLFEEYIVVLNESFLSSFCLFFTEVCSFFLIILGLKTIMKVR